MRKILVLVVALMVILSGCGSESKTKETVDSNGESETKEIVDSDGESTNHSSEDEDKVAQENETDPMDEIYRLDILGEWGEGASENKETDEWCYTVYKKDDIGCVHVYQYKGTDRDIVVPDSFDGYPVTVVVDPRMYTVTKYDTDLVSFTRSYDISEITSIQFPDTVYKTYYDLFEDTVWYENQPDGEIYIGNIFYKYKGEVPSGTVVDVKEETLSICEMAFFGCDGLEKVTMPDSLIWLDDDVFARCTSLNEVQFSSNIIELGDKLFREATSLTEIYIPQSLCQAGNLFEKSGIEKVYFEGTSRQWKDIFGLYTQLHNFELETEISFPY